MHIVHKVVIDLEMNPVSKNLKSIRAELPREVIEIGAIRVDETNTIVDEFHCFVRPGFNDDIAPHITKLTGIRYCDVVDAVLFEEAIKRLENWIGYDSGTVMYSWSDSDYRQMVLECRYKGITYPKNMVDWVDFQSEYYETMELESNCRQLSLHKAAEQFGIVMDEKKKHSALYDAEITTELLIPILTGTYRIQSEYMKKAGSMECEESVFTLGDSFGKNFEEFLLTM